MNTSHKNKVNQISNGVKAIFLDRDGVINKYPGYRKYVTKLSEFRMLPNVLKAIALLTKANFKIFIISNQAGVSKGLYSDGILNEITERLIEKVDEKKGKISGVYYCRHQDSQRCVCRKPKAGLIYQVLKDHKIRRQDSKKMFFVGDSIRDVLTAKQAGIKSILVFSGLEKLKNKDSWEAIPDYTAKDLFSAVKLVLKLTR